MKNQNLKQAYLTMALLLSIIVVGTVGFSLLDFTLPEAFYQTIITIATVGFEEVHQLDNRGMWFTSFLVIFSVGIFAYAVSTLIRFIVEGVFRNSFKDSKVKRKIDRLEGHVVICGYGRNGKQACLELLEHDEDIVVIEKDAELVQSMRESPGMLYVEGDAADDDILKEAKLEKAKAMITTLPVDADNLFVVLTARELNPHMKIISRASADNSDLKLKRAGATNVIMPDRIGGARMAKLVAQPDIVEFIDFLLLQSEHSVVLDEIGCEKLTKCFEGKSIRDLDAINNTGATIIGIKKEDRSYAINPDHATILKAKDKLFALGTREQIDQLIAAIISGIA